MIVSLAAGAAAFVLLYRLTCLRLGEEAARHTVLFLAVAPTSLFFGAVYSESLFLLLAVATFLLAERGRFWAGGSGGGARASDPLGRSGPASGARRARAGDAPDRRRSLAGVAVAPLLFAIYPAVLAIWIGHPLAFLDAQKVVWERRMSPAGPLGGVVAALQDRELLDLGVAFALIALGVVAWRRIGARLRPLHPDERRASAHVRVGQGAALVDAAVRRRRLPGLHGARDAGPQPARGRDHGDDSRRGALRVCGQMGIVVLGRLSRGTG